MGQDINQIADINHALDIQAKNQEALLAELTKILGSLEVPESALKTVQTPDFTNTNGITTLELSAKVIYAVLNGKFDRGIKDIRGVAERLDVYRQITGSFEDSLLQYLAGLLKPPAAGRHKGDRLKPHRMDALNSSLVPLAPLIQLLGQVSPEKYMNFRLMYESIGKAIITGEIAEVLEHLKHHNLALKTPDQKPSCKQPEFCLDCSCSCV